MEPLDIQPIDQNSIPEQGIQEEGFLDIFKPFKEGLVNYLREKGTPEAVQDVVQYAIPDSPLSLIPAGAASGTAKQAVAKPAERVLDYGKILKDQAVKKAAEMKKKIPVAETIVYDKMMAPTVILNNLKKLENK